MESCASAVQPMTVPLPCFPGKQSPVAMDISNGAHIQQGVRLSEIARLNCAEFYLRGNFVM